MPNHLSEALAWFKEIDGCAYHNTPNQKDCPTCAGWVLARAVRELQKDVRIQALMSEREARTEVKREIDVLRETLEAAIDSEQNLTTRSLKVEKERDSLRAENERMREAGESLRGYAAAWTPTNSLRGSHRKSRAARMTAPPSGKVKLSVGDFVWIAGRNGSRRIKAINGKYCYVTGIGWGLKSHVMRDDHRSDRLRSA